VQSDSDVNVKSSWADKSNLEKALLVGMHGPPELKREEKALFLGEFRERVIRSLTKDQVKDPGIYPEIVEALKDSRTVGMLISGDIDWHFSGKYQKLASEMGKKSSIMHDPELKGDIGLVVVSDVAEDVEDVMVENREARLKRLGLPLKLINSAGKKVCDRCYDKITGADPGEIINYGKLTLSDRFWGEKCNSCQI